MLQEKERQPKELYHVTYIRKMEKERAEEFAEEKAEMDRLLAEQYHEARYAKGSNVQPIVVANFDEIADVDLEKRPPTTMTHHDYNKRLSKL